MNYPISALFNQGCQSALVHAFDDGVSATAMLNVDTFPNGIGYTTFLFSSLDAVAGAITYTWSNSAKTITASSGNPFGAIAGSQTYIYNASTASLDSGDFATVTYLGDNNELISFKSKIVSATGTVLTLPSSINLTRNRVVVSVSIPGNVAPQGTRLCLSSIHIKSDTALDFVVKNGSGSIAFEVDVVPSIEFNVISLGPIGILLNDGMQIGFLDKTGLVTNHDASAVVTYKVLS